MYLFKKRIPRVSIGHPLSKIAKRFTDDEMEKMTNQLKEGDRTVIQEILAGHAQLAISIAAQYANLARGKNKGMDLVSEAMLSMLRTCEKMIGVKDYEGPITGRLISRLHSDLSKFLLHDSIVRIPAKAQFLKKDLTAQAALYGLKVRLSILRPVILDDLLDILDHSIRTPKERRIIDLRRKGYTDLEIGKLLDIDSRTVGKIRKNIEQRFDEYHADISTVQ